MTPLDEKPVPIWVLLLISCLGVQGTAIAVAYLRRTGSGRFLSDLDSAPRGGTLTA